MCSAVEGLPGGLLRQLIQTRSTDMLLHGEKTGTYCTKLTDRRAHERCCDTEMRS